MRDDRYISGGFVERKVTYYKSKVQEENEIIFNDKQLVAFEKLIANLKKRNIDFFLVHVPVVSSLYKSYSNFGEFDSVMNYYGEYYNFNEILNLEDSLDFYDAHHLNQNGVEKFNKKLIGTLLNDKINIVYSR